MQTRCNRLVAFLGPLLTRGPETQTTLAAFLEAKKAKETEKATQRAVTNCGRAVFRINAHAGTLLIPSEKDHDDNVLANLGWKDDRFHSLRFMDSGFRPKVSSRLCCMGLLEEGERGGYMICTCIYHDTKK